MLREKKNDRYDYFLTLRAQSSLFDPYQDTSGWYPRYESKESRRSKQIPSIERDLDFGRRGNKEIDRPRDGIFPAIFEIWFHRPPSFSSLSLFSLDNNALTSSSSSFIRYLFIFASSVLSSSPPSFISLRFLLNSFFPSNILPCQALNFRFEFLIYAFGNWNRIIFPR